MMLFFNFMPYLIQYGTCSVLTIPFLSMNWFFCYFPLVYRIFFCNGIGFPHHFTCSWQVAIPVPFEPLKWNTCSWRFTHFLCFCVRIVLVLDFAIFIFSSETSERKEEGKKENGNALNLLQKLQHQWCNLHSTNSFSSLLKWMIFALRMDSAA